MKLDKHTNKKTTVGREGVDKGVDNSPGASSEDEAGLATACLLGR